MLRNYFKIAFRNLSRNKVFSVINIFGLATGLSVCLLIMLYIIDETGYDKYHKDADRIYRIASSVKGENWPSMAAPVAQALKNEMPEVEQSARLLKLPGTDNILLKNEQSDGNKFYETNGYYVDPDFFQLFDYSFKSGRPLTSLNEPNTVVLSEAVAAKLFGKQDPLNKLIKIGLPFGEFSYTVKGVFKDTGNKSHIPAHFFISMNNSDVGGFVKALTNWSTNNIFHTYVKLHKGVDPEVFSKKLQAYYNRKAAADLKAMGISRTLFLQPLPDIYLHSDMKGEIASNGNITYLYILGSVAVFILLIACINFMNLSTARSEKRAREVGVRKVIGANQSSLVQQFLGESFIMCLIALVLAIILTLLFLPVFNELTNKNISAFSQPKLIGWIAGLALFTGLLSGLYPAFYLSSFRPVSVLKGKIMNSFSVMMVRKGLVIFQFTISICFILGAIIIWQQMNFIKSKNLGFDKDQQIVIPLLSTNASKNYHVLKEGLLKNPEIKTVTSGSSYPGIPIIDDMLFYAEGKTVGDALDIRLASVEDDYFKTLGLSIVSGRAFSNEFKADSGSIVLNEAAIKDLGYNLKDAVGKKISYDWEGKTTTLQIVGIVKDFNFESLHNEIKPLGFTNALFTNKYLYTIARLQTNDYAKSLKTIEATWNTVNPGTPFTYSFIDQDFAKNYEKDQRTSKIVICFTIIAILIACLGLFGLAAFSAEQRTREIGVRKVLGATVMNITQLLSKDFLKLVLLAIVIATPVAFWGMQKWLQNFAYRIDIQWWMFALAGILAVLIAFVTVSFQAIKAALMNPVKSLRTE